MWLPTKAFDLFRISKDSVDSLREELSAIRAERDILKVQVNVANNHFDWLRLRINQLEIERAQLLEKATGIKTAIPEIVRTPSNIDTMLNNFSFEDVGNEAAKKLGLPVYD